MLNNLKFGIIKITSVEEGGINVKEFVDPSWKFESKVESSKLFISAVKKLSNIFELSECMGVKVIIAVLKSLTVRLSAICKKKYVAYNIKFTLRILNVI